MSSNTYSTPSPRVAKASMAVAAEEKSTLEEICIALDVNPAFPERILGQYEDYVLAGDFIN